MKNQKYLNLFLWAGLFIGLTSSFLYYLFKLRENKKDLSSAFADKYINISEDIKAQENPSIPQSQVTSTSFKKDSLKVINGIGPAIELLLNENDILTFKDLSEMNVEDLKNILRKKNLRLSDPETWPAQAKQLLQKQE